MSVAGPIRLVEYYGTMLLPQIRRLRDEVWGAMVELQPGHFTEDTDCRATHVVALQGALLMSAARLSFHNDSSDVPDGRFYRKRLRMLRAPLASMNRLVVHPAARGRGLATLMDRRRVVLARKAGVRTIVGWWSEASGPNRLRALEALGFRHLSGIGPGPVGRGIPLFFPVQ